VRPHASTIVGLALLIACGNGGDTGRETGMVADTVGKGAAGDTASQEIQDQLQR
jgi:hypothetical protein